VDRIIRDHGSRAIARIAAAYRDGATDAEALEAGTGQAVDELYAGFFAELGVDEPQPVEAEPLLPSNVELPPGAEEQRPGSGMASPEPATGTPRPGEEVPAEARFGSWPALVVTALLIVGLLGAAFSLRRRTAPEARE
jgi:hypothetical protein